MEFIIEGNLSSQEAWIAAEKANHATPEEIQVSVGSTTDIEKGLAVFEVTPIAIALLQFIIAIWQAAEERRLSASKLREVIDEAMMKKGVVDFRIDSIQNADEVLGDRKGFCDVMGTDLRRNRQYKIWIAHDGEAWVLKVN